MRAFNHALSGALVGLTVAEPLLAAPLAFLSHFAQDAVPHYDLPGTEKARLTAPQFTTQLVLDAGLCLLLVAALALARPERWLQACICAFLAASPDLMWLPKFKAAQKGRERGNRYWWERFHSRVQWKTGPQLWWVEVAWCLAGLYVAWRLLG